MPHLIFCLACTSPLVQAPPTPQGPIKHVITFYRNGIFTVNNGPPRRVDDPANLRFITSISKVCKCVCSLN